MMAQIETNEGGKGESFVRQWASQNKLSKFTNIFIEMELTIDELLFLAVRPKEIEEFCVENGIKSIHKKRFEDALIKLISTHSKNDDDNKQQQQIIVATLSVEEDEIINNVNKLQKHNKDKKEKIDNLVKKVENKQKLCANNINLAFSELQKALDDRQNKLMHDLQTVSTEKKNKLLSAKQKIQKKNEKIKSFQQTCNQLLLNWKMDKMERKQTIVNVGGNIINDKALSKCWGQIDRDISIEFCCNKSKTDTFVATFGFVDGVGVPEPPEITVKEIRESSVKLVGAFEKGAVECLQVDVAEFKGAYESDMKLEWKTDRFEVKQANEEYDVQQLKSECDYVLKAKCKNGKGWSQYASVQTFKTKKDELKFVLYNSSHFAVSNNGKTIKGRSHCYASSAYIGSGYNSGIHSWSIKRVGKAACASVVGIFAGTRNTESRNGTHHYFYNKAGHSYYYSNMGSNDVVKIILDCINWGVTFFINKKQKKQDNIEMNQTYYFALTSCGAAAYCHYEIVSD